LLPKLPQKSVVIMDNAAFHKDKEMQEQLIKAGMILEYLPPYSDNLISKILSCPYFIN